MKRSRIAWLVILSALAAFCCIGAPIIWLAGRGPRAGVSEALRQGEVRAQPVITALEEYRARHSSYPVTLQRLVDEGLVEQVPSIPRFSNLDEQDLIYQVSADASLCFIAFGYSAASFLPEFQMRSYVSDAGQWQDDVPEISALLARKRGREYRQSGSIVPLEKAIKAIAESGLNYSKTDCINLWKDWVVAWIGQGEPATVPAQYSPTEGDDREYRATDSRDRFVIIFNTSTWKDGYGRSLKVVDRILRVITSDDGRQEWIEVCDCR